MPRAREAISASPCPDGAIRTNAAGPQAPLKVQRESVRLVSERTGHDGIVTRTVDIALAVAPKDWDADRAWPRVQDVIEAQEGQFVSGIGRVTSAKVTNAAPFQGGRVLTVRFTLASRTRRSG